MIQKPSGLPDDFFVVWSYSRLNELESTEFIEYHWSMKTLDAPLLDRLLDPVSRILTPEVARKLVALRFDAKTQSHINKLARKCNQGQLTTHEQREYEMYVNTIDFIGILQTKARSMLRHKTDNE